MAKFSIEICFLISKYNKIKRSLCIVMSDCLALDLSAQIMISCSLVKLSMLRDCF